MQLLHSDWADFLAGWHFRAQENGLMSPYGVCAISAGPAGHETMISSTHHSQEAMRLNHYHVLYYGALVHNYMPN